LKDTSSALAGLPDQDTRAYNCCNSLQRRGL